MNKEQIKKIFNRLSLFTLCAFSLPFVVHGSSLEVPKRIENHRYSRGETGHGEIDMILEKIVQRSNIPLMSLFSERIGTSLQGSALEISDRINSIKNLMR